MKDESGFTLIEIIATLLLISFMGLLAGLFIVKAIQSYSFARRNAEISQKAQLFFNRMAMELENLISISSISETDPAAICYTIRKDSLADDEAFCLARIGNEIKMIGGTTLPDAATGSLLIDNVVGFQLDFYSGTDDFNGTGTWNIGAITDLYLVKINLSLRHPDTATGSIDFTNMIYLRRAGRYNAPDQWNK